MNRFQGNSSPYSQASATDHLAQPIITTCPTLESLFQRAWEEDLTDLEWINFWAAIYTIELAESAAD